VYELWGRSVLLSAKTKEEAFQKIQEQVRNDPDGDSPADDIAEEAFKLLGYIRPEMWTVEDVSVEALAAEALQIAYLLSTGEITEAQDRAAELVQNMITGAGKGAT